MYIYIYHISFSLTSCYWTSCFFGTMRTQAAPRMRSQAQVEAEMRALSAAIGRGYAMNFLWDFHHNPRGCVEKPQENHWKTIGILVPADDVKMDFMAQP